MLAKIFYNARTVGTGFKAVHVVFPVPTDHAISVAATRGGDWNKEARRSVPVLPPLYQLGP